MKTSIRIICLILALLCIFPAVTGCGKREKAVKTKLTHVFKSEELTMPVESEYMYNMTYANGRIYAMSNESGEDVDGNWFNNYIIFSVNTEGGDYKEIVKLSGDNSGVNGMLVTESGDLYVNISTYSYDEKTDESSNTNTLVKYVDGEKAAEFDLNNLLPGHDYVYFNTFTCDSQGRLYTSFDNFAIMINPDGTLAGTIDFGADTYINNIFIDSADNAYTSYYDQTSGDQVTVGLDFAGMKIGDKLESSFMNRYSYGFVKAPSDSKYDFYYNDNTAIFGYTIQTNTADELCNWIASDINGSNINSFCVIDDEHIVAVTYEYDKSSGYSKNILSLLTHIPDDQVVEKYILTLACIYSDYNIRNAVLDFNKKNDEYKIMIKDYSTFTEIDGDYNSVVTALNNDIIAGNIPDLIQLNIHMPVQSYISKGLFADLYEYIDSDPEIKREDYLTNILSAFETNGKLYELVPSFSVQTVAGKKSIVGDINGWTMDEFNSVIAAHPDALPFNDMTQEQLLQYMCTYTADQFVDRQTGICSFESDNFKKVLEFAKNLSTESMWENFDYENVDEDYWLKYETACRDGRVLLEIEYINSYRNYWRIMKGSFGEDISLVGFPSDTRNGSAISPTIELAMSAKTPMDEGAWQFLRYFLSDDYQKTLDYDFPVKISCLNEMAAEQMKPETYIDADGKDIAFNSTMYIGNEEINIGEITREYVDVLDNFIKSLTMVYRYDTAMIDIIKEEAAAYFAGSKSIDETVKIIQSRVSVYINESR